MQQCCIGVLFKKNISTPLSLSLSRILLHLSLSTSSLWSAGTFAHHHSLQRKPPYSLRTQNVSIGTTEKHLPSSFHQELCWSIEKRYGPIRKGKFIFLICRKGKFIIWEEKQHDHKSIDAHRPQHQQYLILNTIE